MRNHKTFSKRLQFARKASGATQEQIGVRIGLKPKLASSRINRYEKGSRSPDETTLALIAQAFGLPVSYFCEPDDLLAEIIWIIGRMESKAQRKLLQDLKKMDVRPLLRPVEG